MKKFVSFFLLSLFLFYPSYADIYDVFTVKKKKVNMNREGIDFEDNNIFSVNEKLPEGTKFSIILLLKEKKLYSFNIEKELSDIYSIEKEARKSPDFSYYVFLGPTNEFIFKNTKTQKYFIVQIEEQNNRLKEGIRHWRIAPITPISENMYIFDDTFLVSLDVQLKKDEYKFLENKK